MMLSMLHSPIPQLLFAIAIGGGFAVLLWKQLPNTLVKILIRSLAKLFYRAKITGLANFTHVGNPVLLIANHTSLLDAALIAAFLPEEVTFIMNAHSAPKGWLKPFNIAANKHHLDLTKPATIKKIIKLIHSGKKCVIFATDQITASSTLMKIYESLSIIIEKSGATVLPIRLTGTQYTPFSYLKGKMRVRLFPRITLTILKPPIFQTPSHIKGKAKRHRNSLALYDVVTHMIFESAQQTSTLFQSLLDAAKVHGNKHLIMEDIERKPINYQQFIMRSFILGSAITKNTQAGEYVGILLPSMVSTAITFFAMHAFSRIPAMLNFTTDHQNILLACRTAGVKTIYTSQKFITVSELTALTTLLTQANIQIIYLEQLRQQISSWTKLKGALAAKIPKWYYRYNNRLNRQKVQEAAAKPAVALFTSGSEGTPKGVVLSHLNIQANCNQLHTLLDFGSKDKIFNALPLFHCFGLTGGTFLPLFYGVKIFFYPSPLHYRTIPELVHNTHATILFSTDTFLASYAQYANADSFTHVRYVFAGAEKLKESTRKIWAEQFGINILEGYGTTETSPVLGVNTQLHHKAGTVGRLIPGIQYKLEPVPGISDGGKLIVAGPNVMLGYLRHDAPGQLDQPINGEYDTGDIASIDDEQYITLCGRLKRFAKIGGEMISLIAVENYLTTLWPNHLHVVLAVENEKRGEQLLLITNYKHANREEIVEHVHKTNISKLSTPKKIIIADQIPLLATGKVDYVKARELFTNHL